jgi:hypothetical protein
MFSILIGNQKLKKREIIGFDWNFTLTLAMGPNLNWTDFPKIRAIVLLQSAPGFSFLQIFCFNIYMFPLARSMFCIYISWIHFFFPSNKLGFCKVFIYLEVFVSTSFYMFKMIATVDNDVQMTRRYDGSSCAARNYRVKQLCIGILFTYTWIHFVNSK